MESWEECNMPLGERKHESEEIYANTMSSLQEKAF